MEHRTKLGQVVKDSKCVVFVFSPSEHNERAKAALQEAKQILTDENVEATVLHVIKSKNPELVRAFKIKLPFAYVPYLNGNKQKVAQMLNISGEAIASDIKKIIENGNKQKA